MDALLDASLSLPLLGLALLDGLSIGTLLIPVFLLLAPGRLRTGRIALYLVTISVFYLLVGVLFSLGLVNLVSVASGFLDSTAGLVLRLIAGAALLLTGILMPTGKRKREREAVATAATAGGDDPLLPPAPAPTTPTTPPRAPRLLRWRDALLDARTSPLAVMGIALAAGIVEVATMLPYIVGMTMMAEADLPLFARGLGLVAYCAVMILPAVVLLVLRAVAAGPMRRPLETIAGWMQRSGAETTAWILAIIGLLIARDAANKLGLFSALDTITR
ncbi:GAP family protein [Microbacterium sp. GXS0129]|uniref:GAP family protein n=1 Tax=Microbacterium sp. GXS0129 TaxID=3377836 RepID=UPI00383B66D5